MKRIALVLVLLLAGVATSLGLAQPPKGGSGTSSSSTTSTTPGHGPKARCHPVNLSGTVAGGTITVSVTKADPHSSQLVGGTTTLKVDGKVAVKAVACTAPGAQAGSAQTLILRQLKSREKPPQSGHTDR
jgi:hypothetical protein